ASRNDSYLARLHSLKARHLDAMRELRLSAARQQSLAESIAADFQNIEEVLRGIWITGLPSERTSEFVSGHGEVWSAQLLQAHLENAGHSSSWLDARKVLVVEPDRRTVAVDWELSRERLQTWQGAHELTDFLIITGFVAATHDGVATTLK